MSGGSRPVRPSAFRSSAVKAVPLFNSGELSTAKPRALVSWQPSPSQPAAWSWARVSGSLLCRMLLTSSSKNLPTSGTRLRSARRSNGSERARQQAHCTCYTRRLPATRRASAPPSARSPSNAVSGNWLAVAGSDAGAAVATSVMGEAEA